MNKDFMAFLEYTLATTAIVLALVVGVNYAQGYFGHEAVKPVSSEVVIP